jgi:hypothetical protein
MEKVARNTCTKEETEIYRNYAKESMVKEKRKVHEPVVCEDLS